MQFDQLKRREFIASLGAAVARRDREKALPDAWWRTRIWRTQGAAQRQQAWLVHRTSGCRTAHWGVSHGVAPTETCLRLSNKVLRWYTDCCRTPIANTKAMREALNDWVADLLSDRCDQCTAGDSADTRASGVEPFRWRGAGVEGSRD
jgi:hypothetical protein